MRDWWDREWTNRLFVYVAGGTVVVMVGLLAMITLNSG